ncbi:hypothetical protein PC9H_009083 [Pleurotus ostreatus]|uniref:Uncharacterized protein n=2 Tax=Pleurotus ostreatus TaxID=5322 RepID=A0A067NWG1_PLEO1|nr:uncharacterized protein PC9H_009051 [Pleurotus ostreatus]XP_036630018.1 uncharacterized protein PC9H_009083 [Pleurotus ostreatus]KDQ32388.1 hypothetical protein PLEOSDRAFT_154625 [Pleurotus ostreatus PC15]KAF7426682.1 hypothetical protein PC9H_009051 [Pleurotus ostreatus]KAF7426714.1 hypothetical protein PC9H_009083 [Pleurotus ostreatus]KAJ8694275.1 hypothetical protein PTI98_009200 [Pleurotus ostreatus]KAJ8694319.1 hypothetical protein PTI98_009243 [Pleurotus ostreatus]
MSPIIPVRCVVFPSAFTRASFARFMSSGASSKNPLKQSKNAGKEAREKLNNPVDAVSPQHMEKPSKDATGNKEGIGMVDQVGSQSSTAKKNQGKSSK